MAKQNIQQRGNKFRVDLTKGGVRQRVTCASKDEARSILAKLELAREGLTAEQWTIRMGYEACFVKVWAKGRNVEASRRNGEAAIEFFGEDTLLDAISTERIDGWIARLEQIGNKSGTINNKLAALSKIMSVAIQRRKMSNKPHFERQSTRRKCRANGSCTVPSKYNFNGAGTAAPLDYVRLPLLTHLSKDWQLNKAPSLLYASR